MSNPTTPFSWQMPTATDLVTDLPADFEVFGQAVATSMADLLGGTSGQILAKNSNTDMDFVWIANDQGDITGITATSPLTGGGTSGAVTIGILNGTTSNLGAVQLSDSTSSTSTTLAATANAVKTTYDLAAAAVPKSTVTTAGDVIYATGSSAVTRLGIGTAGQVLQVNSGATAPEWATPAGGGGMTLISTTTLSGASTTISVAANSYKQLQLVIRGLDCTADNDVFLQINGITTSIYIPANIGSNNGSAYTYYTKTNGVYLNLPGVDGLGTGNKNNGTIIFYDCNSTNGKVINCNFYSETTSGGRLNINNATVGVTDTAVISSIVIKVASGSFDGGSVLLYGVS
jgi:hypothetical protein